MEGGAAAIAPGNSAAAPDAAAARTVQRDRMPPRLLPPLDRLYRSDDGGEMHRGHLPHSCRAATLLPLITTILPSTTGWRAPAHGARSAIAATAINHLLCCRAL